MNTLYILTTALDKTASAVTSMTDSTPVDLETLVLGDTTPLTILFTNGTSAPSWAGQAGYTLEVGIGTLDTSGACAYSSTTAFSGITNGWSGQLSLNTSRLVEAMSLLVGNAVNWTPYPLNTRTPNARPQLGWFYLQITVVDPSGFPATYANLRIPILNRVLPDGVATTAGVADSIYAFLRAAYVQNRTLVGIASSLSDSTLLCGIPTANIMTAGAKIMANFTSSPNNIEALFELVPTTATAAGFIFQPWDYLAANPLKWRLRGVWILGQPAIYNNDTGLWHYLVGVGASGAASVSCDQTGTALPS